MPPQQSNTRDKLTVRVKNKLKPAGGFSYLLHIVFQVVLAIVVFILVRLNIGLWLPLLVIMLSKWRIFAVRPRFWPANLRANSVDIMVGISVVLFMSHTDSMSVQLIWAVLYGMWLLFIKPRSSVLFISLQSAIGQLCGLMALFVIAGQALDIDFLFLSWASLPLSVLVLLCGLICYLSARHFFDSFNEPYAKLLAAIWGYFGAALLWVLGHMLVVFPKPEGVIAMPLLMLSAIGYGLATVYYLEHFDRLSTLLRRELLYISSAIVLILVISLYFEGSSLIV